MCHAYSGSKCKMGLSFTFCVLGYVLNSHFITSQQRTDPGFRPIVLTLSQLSYFEKYCSRISNHPGNCFLVAEYRNWFRLGQQNVYNVRCNVEKGVCVCVCVGGWGWGGGVVTK